MQVARGLDLGADQQDRGLWERECCPWLSLHVYWAVRMHPTTQVDVFLLLVLFSFFVVVVFFLMASQVPPFRRPHGQQKRRALGKRMWDVLCDHNFSDVVYPFPLGMFTVLLVLRFTPSCLGSLTARYFCIIQDVKPVPNVSPSMPNI